MALTIKQAAGAIRDLVRPFRAFGDVQLGHATITEDDNGDETISLDVHIKSPARAGKITLRIVTP